VRSSEKVEVGAKVDINFTILADEVETLSGVGEVVRVQKNPPGYAVEFSALSQSSMLLIEALVADYGNKL